MRVKFMRIKVFTIISLTVGSWQRISAAKPFKWLEFLEALNPNLIRCSLCALLLYPEDITKGTPAAVRASSRRIRKSKSM